MTHLTTTADRRLQMHHSRRPSAISHVIALVMCLVLIVPPAHADITMPPYLQAVSTNGVWVLVECNSTSAVAVQYGLTTAYGSTATTSSYLGTTGGTYVHRVQLTGLQPNTTYHYRASQGATTSSDAAFKTAVQAGTSFRFAFMSDFQSTATTQDAMVAQLLNQHNPQFSVYGGDMANDGTVYSDYKDDFFTKQQALVAKVPFFGCVGNHDGWGTNPQAFLQAPASASGTQAYYSFDYGDAHFLILNNNVPYTASSAQSAFAKADLAGSSKTWKIVAFHMSAYCAGGHGENADMKTMTTNVFEPCGVDLVLTGHSHFYQHNLVNGIHHMVLGPAHDSPRDPGTASYTIKSVKDSNYGVIDVTPTTLTLNVFGDDCTLLDTLQLTAKRMVSFDAQVGASSDDAEETVSTGAVNLTSTDLELLVDSSPQVVGIRFPNVAIPRGATIATAYVQFKTDEAVNANPTSLSISGEAADNAATFTTASKNISSRVRTAAAVVWSPPDWTVIGEAGANQRTPELKTVVQEIVNRSGWAKGNSLAVIVSGVSTSKRVAESYDKGTGGAPALHVVYDIPLTNQAPQIQSQPWASPNPVTLPNTTTLAVMATDDGLPNPPAKLTYTWSKVSGPGAVTFAGNNGTDSADDCVAGFTTPGSYLIKVTVSDGALTATGQVTVTVTANYAAGLKAEFFDYTTALLTLPDLTGKMADIARVDSQVYYPSTSGTWANLDNRFADYFASRHSGYLKVDTAADYTLYLNSDDGSKLWIDGELLIDNNGLHGMTEKSAVRNLGVGYHAVRIEYFENTGGAGLSFSWSSAVIGKQIVPASALYRDAPTGTNKAPSVGLTSPANGATLTAPASFSLNAIANDADGTISKVEFYRGTTLLGTDTSSPYSYTWSGVLAGAYSLTAKAYDNSGAVTTSTAIAVTVTPNYTAGLKAEFFDYTSALSTIPDLTGKTADITRVDAQIDYPSTSGTWANLDSRFSDTYASRHTGYLKVATAGDYTLYLNSDDGSRLYLDGVLVINNDGLHGMTEKSVVKNLAAGYHSVKVEFFENDGGAGLSFSWAGPSIGKQIIPAGVLYYDASGSN